ncbi:MAG: hypothetical protein H6621_03770 [Halobacteriovoraceae bacterium]|nr:hypothetical protein [Halobacteriovoraceae bacterium]MCB9094166.1 hypothetical protein [Halobacteriovoraceae bacterium]
MKNWLIRTRTNHLLGPITKVKLLELIENGSIHDDDEVCSGNGYWFYLREVELLNKYIYGEVVQGFNPVSEALNEVRQRESNGKKNETQTEETGVVKIEELELETADELELEEETNEED